MVPDAQAHAETLPIHYDIPRTFLFSKFERRILALFTPTHPRAHITSLYVARVGGSASRGYQVRKNRTPSHHKLSLHLPRECRRIYSPIVIAALAAESRPYNSTRAFLIASRNRPGRCLSDTLSQRCRLQCLRSSETPSSPDLPRAEGSPSLDIQHRRHQRLREIAIQLPEGPCIPPHASASVHAYCPANQ